MIKGDVADFIFKSRADTFRGSYAAKNKKETKTHRFSTYNIIKCLLLEFKCSANGRSKAHRSRGQIFEGSEISFFILWDLQRVVKPFPRLLVCVLLSCPLRRHNETTTKFYIYCVIVWERSRGQFNFSNFSKIIATSQPRRIPGWKEKGSTSDIGNNNNRTSQKHCHGDGMSSDE